MTYDFAKNAEAWASPPVDDKGYMPSAQFASWSPEELREFATAFEKTRYDTAGRRNWNNRWVEGLRLDKTTDKFVMDFGCGFGIDGLQYLKAGNYVTFADIHSNNWKAALRISGAFGFYLERGALQVSGEPPYFCDIKFDIFHASGSLHHTPEARGVLLRAVECLNPDGEIRLLLRTDKAWTQATGTPPPPIDADVAKHPKFMKYVRAFDGVGDYCDWYSLDKINYKFGDFLSVKHFEYITEKGTLCVAILKRNGDAVPK